jgi:hypothetical protein
MHFHGGTMIDPAAVLEAIERKIFWPGDWHFVATDNPEETKLYIF